MPYLPPEEVLAKRKKRYYRENPEMDFRTASHTPQSLASRALEALGLDEPYRNDSGSYDYRRRAWDESVDKGSPDLSWFLPEFSDEQAQETAGFLERALGAYNPGQLMGAPSAQRISRDERVLSKLTPEDRAAVERSPPDQADALLLQYFPDWQPKMNPFPSSAMGTREREGDARIGWMPHVLDQWNWSPYSTEDIFSLLGPDSPESVRRDIEAWKGGSSTIDRSLADAVGAPEPEGGESDNPYVDPIEMGSAALYLGVPGAIAATYKGGKKVVGAAGKVAKAAKKRMKRPGPIGAQLPPNYTEKAAAGGTRFVGGGIAGSDGRPIVRANRTGTARVASPDTAAMLGAGAATAGVGGYAIARDARKRRKKGREIEQEY